jgi:hypothetical protein
LYLGHWKRKCTSSSTFVGQNLQNLWSTGIFVVPYLPVSIAKECALILNFVSMRLKSLDIFKLNLLCQPLCVTGHCSILDNLNLEQNVLEYWPSKPITSIVYNTMAQVLYTNHYSNRTSIHEWIPWIYIWIYGSHIEGIHNNWVVFKLQRHHSKQYYRRLTYVTPHPTAHTHSLSLSLSTQ